MPQVVDHCPHVRLVFLAGQHPGNTHPMRVPQEARELAQALGLLDRHIFFYERWVPYTQRADFLLEADIAISLHRDHLETAYAAIRSRFLDHLWAELPSVVSAGDAAAELFQQAGAALVVESGNSHQLAETILYLLNHPEKQHVQRQAARELVQTFTWAEVLKPLIWFCQSPHRIEFQGELIYTNMMSKNPSKTQPEESHPEATALQPEQILFAARDAATAVVEQTWRLHEQSIALTGIRGHIRQFFINQFVRPFVIPIVEQQQTYNTALLRSLYTFAEITDRLRQRLDDAHARLDDAHARLDDAHARLDDAHTRLDDAHAHLDDAHARLDNAHARLDNAHARLDDFGKGLKDFHADFNVAYGKVELAHARLDGLDVGIQGLNEQVLHQRHLVSQFVNEMAEQVAGLEEANDQVQERLLSFDAYKRSSNASSDIQE
jgi:exonuclease VII small subunit